MRFAYLPVTKQQENVKIFKRNVLSWQLVLVLALRRKVAV